MRGSERTLMELQSEMFVASSATWATRSHESLASSALYGGVPRADGKKELCLA